MQESNLCFQHPGLGCLILRVVQVVLVFSKCGIFWGSKSLLQEAPGFNTAVIHHWVFFSGLLLDNRYVSRYISQEAASSRWWRECYFFLTAWSRRGNPPSCSKESFQHQMMLSFWGQSVHTGETKARTEWINMYIVLIGSCCCLVAKLIMLKVLYPVSLVTKA